jgi:hypothetical protein
MRVQDPKKWQIKAKPACLHFGGEINWFGPKKKSWKGEIQKSLSKSTLAFGGRGGETQKTINFGDKLSFILSFLFFLSACTAATYIFMLLPQE